jgi:uncharacterized phiE125 gp8 family phage protein
MSLQLVTAPAVEPVTLSDAKAHLKVDTTDDDAPITALITAARIRAEWIARRAFVTQSWVEWRDAWPEGAFALSLPPLQSLTSITVYDPDDNATVVDASLYRVDANAVPARIAWKETAVPPSNLRSFNAVAIAFTAGYGDLATDVPEPIRRAILAIVADLYAHRGDDAPTPAAALALLEPYRVLKV